jgi:hypothetical protein
VTPGAGLGRPARICDVGVIGVSVLGFAAKVLAYHADLEPPA